MRILRSFEEEHHLQPSERLWQRHALLRIVGDQTRSDARQPARHSLGPIACGHVRHARRPPAARLLWMPEHAAAAAHEITRRAGMRAGLCGIQLHQRQQHDRAGLQTTLGRPRLLSVIGPNPICAWQTQSSQPPSLLSFLLCGARPLRSARLRSCMLLANEAVGTRVELAG